MSEVIITEGSVVTLHFSLMLKDGEIIDSTFNEEPAIFTVGDGTLFSGFEESVIGLRKGAKEVFTILPEKGFGQHNPSNIQIISRDQFGDDIELEEGLVLSFADAQNTELPGVVTEFDERNVTVDFNHPLSGKDILFEVEIISVEPALKH